MRQVWLTAFLFNVLEARVDSIKSLVNRIEPLVDGIEFGIDVGHAQADENRVDASRDSDYEG